MDPPYGSRIYTPKEYCSPELGVPFWGFFQGSGSVLDATIWNPPDGQKVKPAPAWER